MFSTLCIIIVLLWDSTAKILKSGKILSCFSSANTSPYLDMWLSVSRAPPRHILPAFINLHGKELNTSLENVHVNYRSSLLYTAHFEALYITCSKNLQKNVPYRHPFSENEIFQNYIKIITFFSPWILSTFIRPMSGGRSRQSRKLCFSKT